MTIKSLLFLLIVFVISENLVGIALNETFDSIELPIFHLTCCVLFLYQLEIEREDPKQVVEPTVVLAIVLPWAVECDFIVSKEEVQRFSTR